MRRRNFGVRVEEAGRTGAYLTSTRLGAAMLGFVQTGAAMRRQLGPHSRSPEISVGRGNADGRKPKRNAGPCCWRGSRVSWMRSEPCVGAGAAAATRGRRQRKARSDCRRARALPRARGECADGAEGAPPSLVISPERIRAMDDQGIDVEALSINPIFWYKAEPDLAGQVVKLQNEKLAEICAAQPDRFLGLASVALQHPDLE